MNINSIKYKLAAIGLIPIVLFVVLIMHPFRPELEGGSLSVIQDPQVFLNPDVSIRQTFLEDNTYYSE